MRRGSEGGVCVLPLGFNMTEADVLKKQNDEFRQQAIDKLVTGGVKDYAEYRELVGVIRGLDHANYNLQDFKQRMERLNDE